VLAKGDAHRGVRLCRVGLERHRDVVATSAKGTAIAFHRAPASNENIGPFVDGIVTGGGRVRLTGREDYSFIDTTGTHPDLAVCNAAIADTAAASSTFAALSPTHTLGDLLVPPDPSSSNFVNVDATGSPRPVLNFHDLFLADGPSNCWLTGSSGGLLLINTDPGAEVVINVSGIFHLGNCALLDSFSADRLVVNVVGKGPQIIVGESAELGYHMGLLAPQRTVVTLDGFGEATDIHQVWAKNVVLKGHNHVYSPMCDGASPSGAFIDGPVAY
jgi:hypothetical protein